MEKQYTGPFFVKRDDEYVLADICEECAFGDEISCYLTPCIHFCTIDEKEDDLK